MRMILCEIDFKQNTNCKSYHNIFLMILVTFHKKSMKVSFMWREHTGYARPRPPISNRDLKVWGQRRRRKRHFKSEFTVFWCSSRLFQLSYFFKCGRFLLELNSWDHPSPERLERQRKVHPPLNVKLERCSRAVTAKKCTNKVCCTYCFFDVPVALAVAGS